MRGKLIAFPTVEKSKRLAERARILGENFHDPEHGVKLMIYLVRKMYDVFAHDEMEFLELNILAKLHELDSYLSQYEVNNEEGNSN